MSRLRFKRADGLDFGDSISLCLGDVAEYRKSRRVAQEVVYVSTEDLLKDIEGISKRELTEAEGVEFFKGDILLGNIRPYLKKIWLADCQGVCSADVLVIRSKSIYPSYLFYMLSSEDFFRHIADGYKGSKMPRGDKKQIMEYQLNIPEEIKEQQKIAAFFTALDEKIKIYSQKIDYLHNLKKGVVKKLFSEISSGEEFILGDLVGRISSGKTKNVKDNIGKYPLCGSTGVIGCCRHHEYSGEKILIARVGANAGTVNFHYGDCGVTDNTLVISSCKSTVSLKWLFHFLTFKNLTKMVFGSGQPLITASQLKNISVPVPSIECQIVVVNTLDTMDKAVEIASKKLDCLQSFKKAFMQQMFV